MKVINIEGYGAFFEAVQAEVTLLNPELFEVVSTTEEGSAILEEAILPYLNNQYMIGADVAETAQTIVARFSVDELTEEEYEANLRSLFGDDVEIHHVDGLEDAMSQIASLIESDVAETDDSDDSEPDGIDNLSIH